MVQEKKWKENENANHLLKIVTIRLTCSHEWCIILSLNNFSGG